MDIQRIADNYGSEEWSTGVFISGTLLSHWLMGAMDHFNTADRSAQNIRKDLKILRTSLNKVLDGPKHAIKKSGQEDALEAIVEAHHNIIYRCIGLDDHEKINQVLAFIKSLEQC